MALFAKQTGRKPFIGAPVRMAASTKNASKFMSICSSVFLACVDMRISYSISAVASAGENGARAFVSSCSDNPSLSTEQVIGTPVLYSTTI
jgi:hypothetical protein